MTTELFATHGKDRWFCTREQNGWYFLGNSDTARGALAQASSGFTVDGVYRLFKMPAGSGSAVLDNATGEITGDDVVTYRFTLTDRQAARIRKAAEGMKRAQEAYESAVGKLEVEVDA